LLDPANRLLLLAANANRIMTLPQVLSESEFAQALVPGNQLSQPRLAIEQ